jgi:predicted AlkP superfamily phosphohydrolase/phosphomutase
LICVLQFDSASASVLARMQAQGRLPVLAELAERGRRLDLATPAEHFAAGAFYSLYSGVEIGDHGIFYPFQWDATSQRARYATAYEAPPPVWELLAAQGRSSLVIDPYESRPPRVARGVLACGVGFTDRVVLPKWSVPAGERRRLERRLGRTPGATEVFGKPAERQLLRLRRSLIAAPNRVAAAACEHLDKAQLDLP